MGNKYLLLEWNIMGTICVSSSNIENNIEKRLFSIRSNSMLKIDTVFFEFPNYNDTTK